MINFSRDPNKYQAVGAFMARVGSISDEMDLFCRLSEALHFPENAGGGWNGIDDELRDLSWIAEKEVVIVHTDVPQLHPVAWQTYISILSYAVDAWENDDEHHLTVIFPEDAHPNVQAALRGLE